MALTYESIISPQNVFDFVEIFAQKVCIQRPLLLILADGGLNRLLAALEVLMLLSQYQLLATFWQSRMQNAKVWFSQPPHRI